MCVFSFVGRVSVPRSSFVDDKDRERERQRARGLDRGCTRTTRTARMTTVKDEDIEPRAVLPLSYQAAVLILFFLFPIARSPAVLLSNVSRTSLQRYLLEKLLLPRNNYTLPNNNNFQSNFRKENNLSPSSYLYTSTLENLIN